MVLSTTTQSCFLSPRSKELRLRKGFVLSTLSASTPPRAERKELRLRKGFVLSTCARKQVDRLPRTRELRLRKGFVLSTWTLTRDKETPRGSYACGRAWYFRRCLPCGGEHRPRGAMPAGRLGIPDVGNVLSMPAKGFVLSTSEPWERLCIPDISASSKTVPRS